MFVPDWIQADERADCVVVGESVVAAALDVGGDQVRGEPLGCKKNKRAMALETRELS